MDSMSVYQRALDATAQLVDRVTPAQLALPTPCAAWNVRALLAHLVGGNLRWAALAQGGAISRPPAQQGGPGTDRLDGDPTGAVFAAPEPVFAAPEPVADDLPEIDRLPAYLGRRP